MKDVGRPSFTQQPTHQPRSEHHPDADTGRDVRASSFDDEDDEMTTTLPQMPPASAALRDNRANIGNSWDDDGDEKEPSAGLTQKRSLASSPSKSAAISCLLSSFYAPVLPFLVHSITWNISIFPSQCNVIMPFKHAIWLIAVKRSCRQNFVE